MKKPNGKLKSVKIDGALYSRLKKLCDKEGLVLKTYVERKLEVAIDVEERSHA